MSNNLPSAQLIEAASNLIDAVGKLPHWAGDALGTAGSQLCQSARDMEDALRRHSLDRWRAAAPTDPAGLMGWLQSCPVGTHRVSLAPLDDGGCVAVSHSALLLLDHALLPDGCDLVPDASRRNVERLVSEARDALAERGEIFDREGLDVWISACRSELHRYHGRQLGRVQYVPVDVDLVWAWVAAVSVAYGDDEIRAAAPSTRAPIAFAGRHWLALVMPVVGDEDVPELGDYCYVE